MLSLLVEYARAKNLAAEPGFTKKAVKWSLQIGANGRFLGVVPLEEPGDKKSAGKSFDGVPDLSLGELKRGGSGCRHFLVDNTDVLARLSSQEDPKLDAKHAYFVALLRRAAREVPLPALELCAAALDDPATEAEIRAQLLAQKAKPTDNGTFFVPELGHLVELDSWRPWWRAFRATLGGGEVASTEAGDEGGASGRKMLCLASGELVMPVLTHPKIKGLADVGGLATGDVLASFKQDSFRSYGLVQAENAAVSAEMAATYRAALNDLLAKRSSRLGQGARIAWWYSGADVLPEEDPFAFFFDSSDEYEADKKLRALLDAIRTGDRPRLLSARYHGWTLSGASGRIMVRGFEEGSFPDLVARLDAWFRDLAIVRGDGEGLAKAPKFSAVLGCLVRKKLDEVPVPTEASLWQAALHPTFFPEPVAAQVLGRLRSDIVTNEPLRAHRFGVLRAYLRRRSGGKDDSLMPGLNPEHPAPAYQCGRLLAVFAKLQYEALGDVGAGVIQRYYAAASVTPALIFGRLAKTSNFHLEKLRGRERDWRSWHEHRIGEVMSRIDDHFPTTLQLTDQSLFALGYYHQLAEDRRKKSPVEVPESPVLEASEEN
jgi:CRISPR-associated protein Csd1